MPMMKMVMTRGKDDPKDLYDMLGTDDDKKEENVEEENLGKDNLEKDNIVENNITRTMNLEVK